MNHRKPKTTTKPHRRPSGIIPEFAVRKRVPRAGFAPAHFNEGDEDVELWQVWLHSADGETFERAKFEDIEQAWREHRRKWRQ